MIILSSADEVVAALHTARNIALAAYTLRPGPVERALIAAARRGAHVRVRLEGRPFNDAQGQLLTENRHTVAALRAAGADARLVDEKAGSGAPLHAKAAVVDERVFLDDRNWADDGAETIVQDTFTADRDAAKDAVQDEGDSPERWFATRKHDALTLEARLLRGALKDEDVVVESESFGTANGVYSALDALARSGARPRLLVSSRDLVENVRERKALDTLQRDGVQVRTIDSDEKFALAGSRAWLGSANATAAFAKPDQIDWGVRTDDGALIAHLRKTFEDRWSVSTPLLQEEPANAQT